MSNLTTKAQRARLKVRRDPYFMSLGDGLYLGWRPTSNTWCARYRDASGEQHHEALKLPDNSDYHDAKKCCETWGAKFAGGARRRARLGSVGDALLSGIEWLKANGRADTAANHLVRLRQCGLVAEQIPDGAHRELDPLADVPLADAKLDHFEEWQKRARVGRSGHQRKGQTVNKYFTIVRSLLNRALKLGYVANSEAWRMEKQPEDENESAAYLSDEQRMALLDACPVALRRFLRGCYETGARPGDAARAKVSDFNSRTGCVTFWTRKGKKAVWRPYTARLTRAGVDFFVSMAANKLPTAPLLSADNGGAWTSKQWVRGVAEARAAVNRSVAECDGRYLPPRTVAYSMRHTRITHMLERAKLSALTVAKRTGTSVEQLYRTYHHLIDALERDAIDALDSLDTQRAA